MVSPARTGAKAGPCPEIGWHGIAAGLHRNKHRVTSPCRFHVSPIHAAAIGASESCTCCGGRSRAKARQPTGNIADSAGRLFQATGHAEQTRIRQYHPNIDSASPDRVPAPCIVQGSSLTPMYSQKRACGVPAPFRAIPTQAVGRIWVPCIAMPALGLAKSKATQTAGLE